MAKNTTKTAKEFLDQKQSAAPEGYGGLAKLTERLELSGWIRPEAGLHVYGELLSTCTRKDPRPNQSEQYLVIELAMPTRGLVLPEDQSDDAEEGLIEAGHCVGINLIQGLKVLMNASGKVHIHFLEQVKLPNGTSWWRCEVEGDLTRAATQPAPSNGAAEDNVPF